MHDIHVFTSYIDIYISTIYELIIDPHNDQLPLDLTAKLLERCTNIAEVMV